MSRALDSIARRYADNQSDRMAATPTSDFFATVTAVTPGAAKDGNALVQVRWRGGLLIVAGYAASYTPVVGHWVKCDLIDNQSTIAYRVIGQP